jgi:hypothetical protein
VLLPPPYPASDPAAAQQQGVRREGSAADVQGGALPVPPLQQQQQRSRGRPPGGPVNAASGGTQQVPTQTGSGGPLMGRPRLVEVIVEARSNGAAAVVVSTSTVAATAGVQGVLQAQTSSQAGGTGVGGAAVTTHQGTGEAPAGAAATTGTAVGGAGPLQPTGKQQQGTGSPGATGVVVDLSRLSSFKELWEHLASALANTSVSGCLAAPDVKLVYMDGEGDWLRVTQDDAWPAFVAAARKLLVSCSC